jgi:hypothetical protein
MYSINIKSKIGQEAAKGKFNPETLHVKVPFTLVPNSLLTNKNLSNNAKLLLINLISNETNYQTTDEALVNILGCSHRALYRLFDELREQGYVFFCTNFDQKTKLPTRKRVFCDIPVFFDQFFDDKSETNLRKNRSVLSSLAKRSLYNNTKDYNNNICNTKFYSHTNTHNKNKAHSTFVEGVKLIEASENEDFNDFEKAFLRFWKEYPVKASKKRARDVFMRKMKNYTPLELIVALRAQKSEKEQRQKFNLFTPSWPHPTTWLNGERWQDHIASPEEIKKEYQQSQRVGQKASMCSPGYKNIFEEMRAELGSNQNVREVKDVN